MVFADLKNEAREYGATQRAEGFTEGEATGFIKGKVEAVLGVFSARGITVTAETRARIAGCSDAATLDRWLARAVTAASAEEAIAGT
jgi:hypothetical protein